MRIAEIYQSVQGEGALTGVESVFIRASGCNLRCQYCDTPFASWTPEGEDFSVPEILDRVDALEARHVVITGGEPMLFAELVPLCEGLASRERHITIETAGTLYLPLHCDLMSISPKLSNSAPSVSSHPEWHHRHERNRHVPDVIRKLIDEYKYQFKFVLADPSDCLEVERYLAEFPEIERRRVLLMPEGVTMERLKEVGSWLSEYCQVHDLTFCPRRQIEWYGNVRRT